MTRPAYHVDVATAAVTNISQPAGAIQTSGFPANSKFASAYANWLFRRLGEWARDLDASGLRASHWLDPATPQLADGNGISFPIGAGLGPLTPDDGGIYYLDGLLVDLSAAAIAAKYPGAFTFAPAATTYIHAKVDDSNGGSSYGALLASLNATEIGYTAIAAVATDATDVTSVSALVQVKRYTAADQVHQGDVAMLGAVEVSGASLAVSAPSSFTNTVAASINSASTTLAATQAGAGFAVDALGTGGGTTMRVRATGTGTALNVTGNANATAASISAGSGEYALSVLGSGAASALVVVGGGSGVSAVTVSAGGGNSPAVSATGSGTAAAIEATSSATAGSKGLTATAGSTTSYAVNATGSATGGATGSRAVYADGQQGTGVEARSSAYYALMVQGDTSSPAYPAIKVVGQDADPTDTFFGGLFPHSSHNQWRYSVAGYGYRGLLSMGPGSALYAVASNTGGTTTENAGVYSTVLTCLADTAEGQGFYGVAAGARVLIRVTMEARSLSAAATNVVNARLLDLTDGGSTIATRSGTGTGATAGFRLLTATTEWQRVIVWAVNYAPPNEGDLQVRLEIQRGTANGIAVRDPVLEIFGTI